MESLMLCLAILAGSSSSALLHQNGVETACKNMPQLIKSSKKYDIDPTIMASLIWVESRWESSAVSWANACGLTQVLPRYVPETCEELKIPSRSIEAGTRSLKKWIRNKKKRTVREALACYNVGNRCLKSKQGISYSNLVLKKALWYKKQVKLYKDKKIPLPMRRVKDKELNIELVKITRKILKKNIESPYGTFLIFKLNKTNYGCLIEEHYRPLDSKITPRGKHKGCSLFIAS